jgi:signal transduction histidine kinase
MNIDEIVEIVKGTKQSFIKFVSANDAGVTGTHQAGIYIPKSAISPFIDKHRSKGENYEKFFVIKWQDTKEETECRFIYYGRGTRNEYRLTRLHRALQEKDLFILVYRGEEAYDGFTLSSNQAVEFLEKLELNTSLTNKGLAYAGTVKNPSGQQPSEFDETTTAKSEKQFKPKAHILRLLGEELIKSPVMAIYELVKNSYDADAKVAHVHFGSVDAPGETVIKISDDGTGIKEEVLENVWLEPGTDFRKPIDESGNRVVTRTPIYGRVPMGEKGVGRFAVHKLGERIRLVTRPAEIKLDVNGKFLSKTVLDYELELTIDWDQFSQSSYLEDIPVTWFRKEDPEGFHFQEDSGTMIEITGLKEPWTRGMARQLKRSTLSMVSPVKSDTLNRLSDNQSIESFDIDLDFGNSWLSDIPDSAEVLGCAPYKMVALIDKDYNLTFEYLFKPGNNSNIGKRTIDDTNQPNKHKQNIRGKLKTDLNALLKSREFDDDTIKETLDDFDKDGTPFGDIMFELYSYDLDGPSLKDTSAMPQLIKPFLQDNAGIKVFKDDLRVFDYGEPGNDWLRLDIKRVNSKKWFSNNQNVGSLYLDSETSGVLVEKTNREGFVESYSYDLLVIILEWLLLQFRAERLQDRDVWLRHNQKGSAGSLGDALTNFRKLVESTDLDNEEKKKQLLLEADKVERVFKEKQEALLLPAGVGLTASVALHEIDKLIPRMEESVKSTPPMISRLASEVQELKSYVVGILSMLKKGGDTEIDLSDSIEEAVFSYRTKLDLRDIELKIEIEEGLQTLSCDRRYFITMLKNLIENSVYWLGTIYSNDKEIYISAFRDGESIQVFVADNGPGFEDDTIELVKPFHSRRKGGMGLGLYIIDTVMVKYGKLIIHTDLTSVPLNRVPSKYSGAIVNLTFKK